MQYTARIKSKHTGGWRVVTYHDTEEDAFEAATSWAMKGYIVAVFHGRRKVAEGRPV
jgi:hypothetical protein